MMRAAATRLVLALLWLATSVVVVPLAILFVAGCILGGVGPDAIVDWLKKHGLGN